jgi:Rrf2 family iron-sulfur cluster assembly transcriptional regulator
MSVVFSRSCEYALQAILYLSRQPENEPALLRDISERLNIPHHFLSKVLQALTRTDVVVSYKGANGGFALGRSPKEITLGDIVKAIDGEAFLNHCVLGFPGCGDDNPCPVHPQWKKAKQIIHDMLHKKTVYDLGKEFDTKLDFLDRLQR